jgi:lysophospholipase L1-like esterase
MSRMHLQMAIVVTTVLAAILPGAAPAHADSLAMPGPLRVLPLGDSITAGDDSTAGTGGYRGPLQRMLADHGLATDFVGARVSGPAGDPEHEGHSGFTIENLADVVRAGAVRNAKPDVILLHIGTNDVKLASTAPGAGERLKSLLALVAKDAPNATILLAQIIPIRGDGPGNARVAQYNREVVTAAQGGSDRVRIVDQYHSLLQPDFGTGVPLHPNDTGYAKMATTWFLPLAMLAGRGTPVMSTVYYRCLDATKPAVNTFQGVHLWPCTSASRGWYVQGSTFRSAGLCLDTHGTAAVLRACGGQPTQNWQVGSDGTVRQASSGRCLGLTEFPTGTVVSLIECVDVSMWWTNG